MLLCQLLLSDRKLQREQFHACSDNNSFNNMCIIIKRIANYIAAAKVTWQHCN